MKLQSVHRWSQEEISLLEALYPIRRVKDIAAEFPDRTKATIVAKALNLGLPSAKLWQPWEVALLRQHFAAKKKQALKQLLSQRSWVAILAHGERLGLKRERAVPRLTVNETYFQRWSPRMAYLLGFIVSDGCIVAGTYTGYSDALKFGVHPQDVDILEKIKYELGAGHAISRLKNAAHLCITSQRIVDDLKGLGIAYRKSLREKVPPVPPQYLRDFIRGIVDGDGGISIGPRNYPTLRVCGGKEVATFIRDHFYKEFGAYSSILEYPSRGDRTLNLCAIAYRCNPAQKLIRYLYADTDIYLERKHRKAIQALTTTIKVRGTSKRPHLL